MMSGGLSAGDRDLLLTGPMVSGGSHFAVDSQSDLCKQTTYKNNLDSAKIPHMSVDGSAGGSTKLANYTNKNPDKVKCANKFLHSSRSIVSCACWNVCWLES